jgi:D-alanine transfer protein
MHAPLPRPLSALPPAFAAVLAAVAFLGAATLYGSRLERQNIRLVTMELAREQDPELVHSKSIERVERVKNQGMSLQRTALQQADLVSVYGSSELRKPIPDKAGIFFSHYPTGFAVFQVGKAGATSIILLEKIAASAPAGGARHLAISLSSTWFLRPLDDRYFAGNFSRQQALHILYDPRLSPELKRDFARRLLDFPKIVLNDSLLGFTLTHLAGATPWDHFLYYLTCPLGTLQNAVNSAQDRFETALYVLEQRAGWKEPVVHEEKELNWPDLLAKAGNQAKELGAEAISESDRYIRGDASYREALDRSQEWSDFELLLRILHELQIEPLVLSMPPDGRHYEKLGIQRSSLALYSQRLHALCDRYGVRCETFDDHIDDHYFLVDHHDHMSVKGWMYYNQAIDDYFHRRPRRN